MLADSGVGLTALRRAVIELQERELGVEVVMPQPTAVRAVDKLDTLAVPLAGRAGELLDEVPYLGDDRGLLRALLNDGGQRAQRLLAHLGVDVAAVRGRLADGSAPDTALDCAPGDAPVAATAGAPWPDAFAVDWFDADRAQETRRDPQPGTTWLHTCHTQVVPVPVERVWALVSDPLRRPEWDPLCREVALDANRTERLTRSDGGTFHQVVADLRPHRRIGWHRTDPAGRTGSGAPLPPMVVQVALAAQDGVTVVRLRQDVPVRNRAPGSLSRWMLTRMVRSQLRLQAHGIAQAAG